MKYLIDTQILLWIFGDHSRLSQKALGVIKQADIQLFVSAVSFWEIAIKISLDKLTLPVSLEQFVEDTLANDIEIIGLEISHILKVASLPYHHRDPFDRLIIAQSLVESLPILSSDDKFSLYEIERVW
ncbi:type II toxin-antitoxin system VapC family toxin [Telluribacter sp.]|jgi:PIN domain nuclease of toxin-antitoxin system|uniref:type II toxin-antitoxin system VapC family toxin n=1 Tax=Telluribacter sp. TaxID=1978767 RepID=UPI002E0F1876|nr:type II toxin-antitoxin system VapC family toxin [Telluribacter sp.]